MNIVKRWNTQINAWELGYWVGTRFHIVGHVKLEG
jgi:hypothetical protein